MCRRRQAGERGRQGERTPAAATVVTNAETADQGGPGDRAPWQCPGPTRRCWLRRRADGQATALPGVVLQRRLERRQVAASRQTPQAELRRHECRGGPTLCLLAVPPATDPPGGAAEAPGQGRRYVQPQVCQGVLEPLPQAGGGLSVSLLLQGVRQPPQVLLRTRGVRVRPGGGQCPLHPALYGLGELVHHIVGFMVLIAMSA